jgi:hypothetical protein
MSQNSSPQTFEVDHYRRFAEWVDRHVGIFSSKQHDRHFAVDVPNARLFKDVLLDLGSYVEARGDSELDLTVCYKRLEYKQSPLDSLKAYFDNTKKFGFLALCVMDDTFYDYANSDIVFLFPFRQVWHLLLEAEWQIRAFVTKTTHDQEFAELLTDLESAPRNREYWFLVQRRKNVESA